MADRLTRLAEAREKIHSHTLREQVEALPGHMPVGYPSEHEEYGTVAMEPPPEALALRYEPYTWVRKSAVLALLDAEAGAAPPEPTPVMPNPRRPLPCGAVDAITRGRCMLDYGHAGAHGFSPDPTPLVELVKRLAHRADEIAEGSRLIVSCEEDAALLRDAITALEGTPHA